MALTTQYIICNISVVKYMHSFSECFRSESNSEMEYKKMDLFSKIFQGYGASAIFVRNFISDVPLSLNTTLQIASHY